MIARLIHIANSFAKQSQDVNCRGCHIFRIGPYEEAPEKAKILVLKNPQYESYPTKIKNIMATHNLPHKSALRKLSSVFDSNGLL